MSKIEVNQISSQCGSTLTIGQSGDTVTLAAGATQSGFGRTGTVDWDTTAKTTGFTAVSGNGYFVNTTSGAVTVTLPATPSAGDIVSLSDYASTWATNNVTIASALINGATGSPVLSTKGQAITFIYVDGTRGWKAVQDNTQDISGVAFTVATGGTITTCGNFKIHTFTSPGTFCVSQVGNPTGGGSVVDYLVVAGGGAGGGGNGPEGGGGGGAGGYRESHSAPVSGCYTASPLSTPTGITIAASPYPISVGAGGTGTTGVNGNVGSNSIFSTITSTGGGGGGKNFATAGGSGGGGGSGSPGPQGDNTVGGAGNTPPVSPPQGNNGGGGTNVGPRGAGGGGGASSVGTAGTSPGGGPGGAGVTTSISASPTAYAGGGGGGSCTGSVGSGGSGGGGAASLSSTGTAGTTNRGGGGGGSGGTNAGANGGSGIVIIRYKFQ